MWASNNESFSVFHGVCSILISDAQNMLHTQNKLEIAFPFFDIPSSEEINYKHYEKLFTSTLTSKPTSPDLSRVPPK